MAEPTASGILYDIRVEIPEQPNRDFKLMPGVYSIGTEKENKIVLPGKDIDWKHAILSLFPDGFWIEDLNSGTGTYLDGWRIDGRQQVKPGNQVGVGAYRITVMPQTAAPEPTPEPTPEPEPAPASEKKQEEDWQPHPLKKPSTPKTVTPPEEVKQDLTQKEIRQNIKSQIHKELHARLNIKRLTASHIDEKDLHQRVQSTIDQIIADSTDKLPLDIAPEALGKEIYDEAIGLGPLEDLLADESITEIMVNGANRIYIERDGRLTLTSKTFMNENSVLAIIERIVAPIGRRIDESQPYVDARLPDGSRVNAIIHPLSLTGPCLTIRKFSKTPYTVADLVGFGSLSPQVAEFIDACVTIKKNIIVSGGTGSGKTTLLNVLSSYLPETERIITIEDAAELRLTQEHVIRLEARPPNMEGKGAISIRDLVRNALRMRPDRIVVGECRGGEALDMLQAMNTGHEGSLTTIHANSPRDVISRLETMVLMSGMDFPIRAIREQVGAAIHLIVQIGRYNDGSRKVDRITEIVGLEGDQITMQDLFQFRQTGHGEDHKVLGEMEPTGSVPTFMEEMKIKGVTIDHTMFDPHAGPHT